MKKGLGAKHSKMNLNRSLPVRRSKRIQTLLQKKNLAKKDKEFNNLIKDMDLMKVSKVPKKTKRNKKALKKKALKKKKTKTKISMNKTIKKAEAGNNNALANLFRSLKV